MYRITNIQTRLQETCANRDDLLSVVNEKSVWAEDRGEILMLQLEQLAEDNSILDTMTLSLPLQEIVESALASFGLKREKKGFSLLHRNKPQKTVSEEEPTEKVKQDLSEQISAPQPKAEKEVIVQVEEIQPISEEEPPSESLPGTEEQQTEPVSVPKPKKKNKQPKVKKERSIPRPKVKTGSSQLIWKLLTVGAFAVSVGTVALVQMQNKQLEDRIELQESQGKIDVVGRFFIANYFSGDSSRLDDFLSKDLKAEGVEAKTGQQAQSIIYESSSQSGDVIKMTFVVTTKSDDNTIKTFRLTLPFEKDTKSLYGYVLTGQPEFSSFGE